MSLTGLVMIVASFSPWEKFEQRLSYKYSPPIYNAPVETSKLKSSILLSLVNSERKKQKLPEIKVDQNLEYIAYLRAKDILENQEFTHEATISGKTMGVLVEKLTPIYSTVWENLAIGKFPNEEDVVTRWRASPKHNEVMLSSATSGGAYVFDGSFYGNEVSVVALILGLE